MLDTPVHNGPSNFEFGVPATFRNRLFLAFIIIMGAAIRFYRLDAQGLWYDELFSVAHSVRTLPELYQILAADAVNPPLHYLALHAWFEVFGFGSLQARVLSAIWGTLSIPLLFLLARRFADTPTSLTATFLLAMSQLAAYYSQEARAYAQAQCFSLAAALAFVHFLRKPNLARSILFFASGLVLVYTHYYGSGTLLALGCFWLIFRRRYSSLVFSRLLVVAALLAAAVLPWFLVVKSSARVTELRLFGQVRAPAARPSLLSPIGALNRFDNVKFGTIEAESTPFQTALGLALFCLPAIGALVRGDELQRRGAALGMLLAFVPFLESLSFGLFGLTFNFRHYSFAVAGYYLAVAIGWRACLPDARLRLAWIAVAGVVCAFGLRANQIANKPDYRSAFLPLAQHYQPGDCETGRPSTWRNRVHFAWEAYYRDRGALRLVPTDSFEKSSQDCGRIWLVTDHTPWMNLNHRFDGEVREADAALALRYRLVEEFDHSVLGLRLYQRKTGTQ